MPAYQVRKQSKMGGEFESTWTSLSFRLLGVGDATIILDAAFNSNYDTQINITGKKVTIWGNNAVLDARHQGRFFNLLNSELELHSVTLRNGIALNGGAVRIQLLASTTAN